MKEIDPKQVEYWYERLLNIASDVDVNKRYASLVQLHRKTLDFYIPALQALTDADAAKLSSDGRSIGIVVAHIMAWEEWQIQVFTGPNREERLHRQMQLQGYYDAERDKMVNFRNVDDFNAYQANKYALWTWTDIQQQAISSATLLQSMFPANPSKEWLNFLDNSPTHSWKILPDRTIVIPAGWYLWIVSLEHEAVEHRKDLIK